MRYPRDPPRTLRRLTHAQSNRLFNPSGHFSRSALACRCMRADERAIPASSRGSDRLRSRCRPTTADDWPQWADQDGDCQDTRQEVLIEESLIAPALDARGCRVIAGRWRDEYTGAVYTDPDDVEIDHRVPLANAHRSGGWAWDRLRKRDYANDLLDPEHLVAVRRRDKSHERGQRTGSVAASAPRELVPLRDDVARHQAAMGVVDHGRRGARAGRDVLVAGIDRAATVRFLAVRRYSVPSIRECRGGDVYAVVIKEWPWLAY